MGFWLEDQASYCETRSNRNPQIEVRITELLSLHSLNASLQMFVHFFHGAVANAAVAGQNPFELVGEQIFHGAGLFRPGKPANIAKGGQGFAFG